MLFVSLWFCLAMCAVHRVGSSSAGYAYSCLQIQFGLGLRSLKEADRGDHPKSLLLVTLKHNHPDFKVCGVFFFNFLFFFPPSGISVSISTFSLVAIAIERYSAICNPLKSRSWQTRSHAYRVITATWVLSLLIMVPYPVFSVLRSFPKANNTVGHMCRLDWPSPQAEQTW